MQLHQRGRKPVKIPKPASFEFVVETPRKEGASSKREQPGVLQPAGETRTDRDSWWVHGLYLKPGNGEAVSGLRTKRGRDPVGDV